MDEDASEGRALNETAADGSEVLHLQPLLPFLENPQSVGAEVVLYILVRYFCGLLLPPLQKLEVEV